MRYYYNQSSIIGDYIKSAVGLILIITAIIFLDLTQILQFIFIFIVILFIIFTIRTFIRHKSHYFFQNNILYQYGIFHKKLPLDQLINLRIKYFSTARNYENGWFQMKLATKDVKLVVDSSLNGFDIIAKTAATALRNKNLPIDDNTNINLQAILKNKP